MQDPSAKSKIRNYGFMAVGIIRFTDYRPQHDISLIIDNARIRILCP